MVKVNHALNHHWCETSLLANTSFLMSSGKKSVLLSVTYGHIWIVLWVSGSVNVTGFERTRLPRTQQEDTLFTITR